MATPLDEATDLLQTMIRNQCVNDGRPESGGEVRNAKTLGAYLAGPGAKKATDAVFVPAAFAAKAN